MEKVLWLASWFPTEEHPLPGDFIERHAKATSLYVPVHVIHVSRIHDKNSRSDIHIKEYKGYPFLRSEICSYKISNFLGVDLIASYCYSLVLYIKRIKAFIKENGRPPFIHVHVTLRCGLAALYCKWFHKIPFIVSEHNGALLSGAENYGARIGFAESMLMKVVMRNASCVTAVSDTLRKGIAGRFNLTRSFVIPNVVDTTVFKPVFPKLKNTIKTFLHVSTLSKNKNVDKILQAFAIVKNRYGYDFCFKVIGPDPGKLKNLASRLGIDQQVNWLQETDQNGVSCEMQIADAVILYSSYESFGCVNIEANASGLPVIVSDIPTFREYLVEGVNALFAGINNEVVLAEKIAAIIDNSHSFDSLQIAATAKKFSFEEVGRQFHHLYEVWNKNENS